MNADPRELEARLRQAEAVIDALRGEEIDAVVGRDRVSLLRLKEVEEALRRSEARYRAVVEDQNDLICRRRPDGTLTFVNGAFCRFFARSSEELLGGPLSLPVAPDDADRLAAHRARLDEAGAVSSVDLRVHCPATGELRWLEWCDRVLADDGGAVTEIQSVARDITRRRRAEDALRGANAALEQRVALRDRQLGALVRKLARAEQRERRRLARVLHDGLQQILAGAQYSLAVARRRAGDAAQSDLDRLDELLEESLEASRALAAQLAPPVLDRQGLVPALRWLAEQTEHLHGVVVTVEERPGAADRELPDTVARLLFEMARELLFNAVKHSGVDEVHVGVDAPDGGLLRLRVADEGRGFDVAAVRARAAHSDSIGMWSLGERVELLGGTIEIDSAPGAGCRVTVVVPFEGGDDGEDAGAPGGHAR